MASSYKGSHLVLGFANADDNLRCELPAKTSGERGPDLGTKCKVTIDLQGSCHPKISVGWGGTGGRRTAAAAHLVLTGRRRGRQVHREVTIQGSSTRRRASSIPPWPPVQCGGLSTDIWVSGLMGRCLPGGRTSRLRTGGHQFSGSIDQANGTTPLPAIASASRWESPLVVTR